MATTTPAIQAVRSGSIGKRSSSSQVARRGSDTSEDSGRDYDSLLQEMDADQVGLDFGGNADNAPTGRRKGGARQTKEAPWSMESASKSSSSNKGAKRGSNVVSVARATNRGQCFVSNNNNNSDSKAPASSAKGGGGKSVGPSESALSSKPPKRGPIDGPVIYESGTNGCLICKKDTDHDRLLICEFCNAEYHIYCLDPPLETVPDGDFFCGKYYMIF